LVHHALPSGLAACSATILQVKKRRHHYVWQHYLKPWTSGGQIACRREGRVFTTATINVAMEKDFYTVRDLTEPDIRFVSWFIQRFPPEMRSIHTGWLEMLNAPGALRAIFGGQDPSVDEHLAELAYNTEEDWHAAIENDAKAALSQLQQGSRQFFLDRDGYQQFMFYLALQTLRTPRFRDALTMMHRGLDIPEPFKGFSPERVAGVVRLMFATNVATSFVIEREHCRLTFLEAENAEFITGDQPATNTYPSSLPFTPPKQLEFYYPVSPTRAVLITSERDSAKPDVMRLSRENVASYNALIKRVSHSQVYGHSEDVLRTLDPPAL
jgi:hypothetical protein